MGFTLNNFCSGFTLVEILVDISIFALVALAVLSAYMASFRTLDLSKAKIAAVALANERMEGLRNMPYDSLATEHGLIYPPGNLLDNETIIRQGITFNVKISISYVDDPFDGNAAGTIAGKPKDLYSYDYKKAEVTVSKEGMSGHLARLTSNVAAKAAETPSNSGIVRICVVDSASLPVSGATITIYNDQVSPKVDIIATTGEDGCIMVPNLPPDSHNSYHLTATKDGFSTDMTYPRTSQNPNALQPDIDVLVQQISSQTLSIDQLGVLNIDIVDVDGQPIANQLVYIEGTKQKWFNPVTYKYSSNQTTDASGHIALPDMEFDNYKVTISGRTILSTSPYQPIDLKPGTTINAKIIVGDASYPRIISCEPMIGKTGDTSASLMIKGANMQNSTVKLINVSGAEIIGTNLQYIGSTTLDVDFNLAGAAIGAWDIYLESGGKSVRQFNGFTITN